jgi:molybdate transport system ATP-binding protein
VTASVSGVEFDGIVQRGNFETAVEFAVAPGEVLAILGPNGAGKTTLLQALAGLLPLMSGHIRIGNRIVDDPAKGQFVAAPDRHVGVIFQEYRLFPHLNVADNVGFSAWARGLGRADARRATVEWLERFDLLPLAKARPPILSGGDQQRVALARALAAEPHLLLLDEPLAALDAQTRVKVQGELRAELSAFAGPVVLVTHDPLEALLLADRILILEAGRVVQTGTPKEIATRPATDYVARLVGLNLYAGDCIGDEVRLTSGGALRVLPPETDGPVLIAIRPSAITVSPHAPEVTSARNAWPAEVVGLSLLADRVRLELSGQPPALADVTPAAVAELDIRVGSRVWLSVKATDPEVYANPRPNHPPHSKQR